jgi:hemolysin III
VPFLRPGLGPPATEPSFPQHTPTERRVDAIVHALGLTLATIGCLALSTTVPGDAGVPLKLGVAVYGIGLLAMLGCSALYNITPDGHQKALYQRLDHAAIFLMIAGTYTPFTLIAIGGAWGYGLLGFVWAVAVAGVAVELVGVQRSDALLTAAYLTLGWIILVAVEPLAASLSGTGMALLVAGGVLYSVGVLFHHWDSLPYQNAIWHGFVVGGAACHYLAVLRELALG